MKPGLIRENLYSFIREHLDQRYVIAIDLRRNGTEVVTYDFSDMIDGIGELVTASVNLYNANGSLYPIGLDGPIKLKEVPLRPSSAIVLRVK